MSFSIGIIGLPNVGKSTTFNALCNTHLAEVANYPFCTIKENRAVIPVPDNRLDNLQSIFDVPNAIPTSIEFVDIAGLVAGASHGEGLGNQFLGNIRNTEAIIHIVRCFDDPNIVHVSAHPNPADDINIINLELMIADSQQLDKKIDKLSHQVKGDKKLIPVMETAILMKNHLSEGKPLSTFSQRNTSHFSVLNQELRFLTAKPFIYLANVSEDSIGGENHYVEEVRKIAKETGATVITLSSKLEHDLIGLPDDEKKELLEIVGLTETGLTKVIRESYKLLGLISFFTHNKKEVRAWEIPEGTTAQKAAGRIHTDFERGFIRAEVIAYTDYLEYKNDAKARAAGAIRLEGKEYIVEDGDIIQFRFNV